ncbi:hypothetical protein LTR62_001520 [Meristemomyces frigidus]|uniref:Uncharacterized protein n=1 Tax=Meristemomyces frigidus TaxID=1508187 RepID=A0AAN7TNH4_9PEZI|nr:hypothetical protein LTR62_001520 [Meristemomyces frigidus]
MAAPYIEPSAQYSEVTDANREELRTNHADNFSHYYIDESIVREPFVEPVTLTKKARGRKRAPPAAGTDGESSQPPAKKSRATLAKEKIAAAPARRSSRSTRGMKRNADDLAAGQPTSIDPPPAKKAKAFQATTTPTSAQSETEMAVFAPVAPARTRQTGITDQFSAEKKLASSSKKMAKMPKPEPIKAEEPKDEAEDDLNEFNDPDEPAAGASKMGKKSQKEVVPKAWIGTTNAMGSTIEKPPCAPLDVPWPCADRTCSSGMTWHPRNVIGRKTQSQFFGRNKKATKRIHPDVWHTYCRKHYQRSYYAARGSTEGVFGMHRDNLEQQFARLKLWRPEATFTIELSNVMQQKATMWYRILRANDNDLDAAKAEFATHNVYGTKPPKPVKRKGTGEDSLEYSFPAWIVDEFSEACCRADVDYDGVYEIMEHIKTLQANGTITAYPPIEFLISEEKEGEVMTDPTDNYALWVAEMETDNDGEADNAAAESKDGATRVKIEDESSWIGAVGATDAEHDDSDDDIEESADDNDVELESDNGEPENIKPEFDTVVQSIEQDPSTSNKSAKRSFNLKQTVGGRVIRPTSTPRPTPRPTRRSGRSKKVTKTE